MTSAAGVPTASTGVGKLPVKPANLADVSRYNQFSTKLEPGQEQAYHDYVAHIAALRGQDPAQTERDNYNYDLRGAFVRNLQPDARGHLGDPPKKPWHPTFSDEAFTSGRPGIQGGHWGRDEATGRDTFTAGPTNLQYQTPDQMRAYFAQQEPEVTLVIPNQGTPAR